MQISERLSAKQKELINNWVNNPPVEKTPKEWDEKIPNLVLPPYPGVKNPKPLESILFMLRDDIEKVKTLKEAQDIIDNFIDMYQINHERSKDEYKALMSLKNNMSYVKLLSHMYASILKFSGLTSPDAHRNRNRYK